VTKRHTWKRITGDANTRPPKMAIFTRSASPSSGDVTKSLQVPPAVTSSEPLFCDVWCCVVASTVHSGRSRKCRMGS